MQEMESYFASSFNSISVLCVEARGCPEQVAERTGLKGDLSRTRVKIKSIGDCIRMASGMRSLIILDFAKRHIKNAPNAIFGIKTYISL